MPADHGRDGAERYTVSPLEISCERQARRSWQTTTKKAVEAGSLTDDWAQIFEEDSAKEIMGAFFWPD